MKLYKIGRIIVALALVLLSACGGNAGQAADGDGMLKIVTTTGMITDITEHVAGEHASVTGLMGAGIDPHLYVASEGDVTLLQEADIIFPQWSLLGSTNGGYL